MHINSLITRNLNQHLSEFPPSHSEKRALMSASGDGKTSSRSAPPDKIWPSFAYFHCFTYISKLVDCCSFLLIPNIFLFLTQFKTEYFKNYTNTRYRLWMLSLHHNSRTIYIKFQLPFLIKGIIYSNTYLAFIFQNKKSSLTVASKQTFAKIT